MKHREPHAGADWRDFVLENGFRASAYEMAHILGQSIEDVERTRATGACKPRKKGKDFSELFSLWHGRAPQDHEWPAPRKLTKMQTYEWQAPEVALLATLVGRMSVKEIAQVLTGRLRQITGDQVAQRSEHTVQAHISKIGLQSGDVIGGITTEAAGVEIQALAVVHQAIRTKQLKTRKIGRRIVIPYDEWEAWKAKRQDTPEGFVRLNSLREPLAINSDSRLSEYAKMGYIPTAVQIVPFGARGASSENGVWYVDGKVADQLIADRREGKPMPWHGKPLTSNLKISYKLWRERQHPRECKNCSDLWGEAGPPSSYDDFILRYPPLALGAKRHLTMKWSPGITIAQLAAEAGRTISDVEIAIDNGMLEVLVYEGERYVSKTDAVRWRARRCPSGENHTSWINLDQACEDYFFTQDELTALIGEGKLKSKMGIAGGASEEVFVSRHQCGHLRETIGFTEEQAASRAGVSVERFRELAEGLTWRQAKGIPIDVIRAVIQRIESREGYTIDEAAKECGKSVSWLMEQLQAGVAKIQKSKWNADRAYITGPMLKRLKEAAASPAVREKLDENWLTVTDAALEAGVSPTTISTWGNTGELDRRETHRGYRYHRDAVRARARAYWETIRYHRAVPPAWLQAEAVEKSFKGNFHVSR